MEFPIYSLASAIILYGLNLLWQTPCPTCLHIVLYPSNCSWQSLSKNGSPLVNAASTLQTSPYYQSFQTRSGNVSAIPVRNRSWINAHTVSLRDFVTYAFRLWHTLVNPWHWNGADDNSSSTYLRVPRELKSNGVSKSAVKPVKNLPSKAA